jgi:hypothetical protein
MNNDDDPAKLLGQSKMEYAKFLENQDVDVLAEAGELLWESLKAHLEKETNTKTNNLQTLTKTASQRGEEINKLFFHCYHFHSWYSGVGVPHDFPAEKKLYLESVKSLERIISKDKIRPKKREIEKAT